MSAHPSKAEFADLVVNAAAGLTDYVMMSGNPDSLLDPIEAAYADVLDDLEALREFAGMVVWEHLEFHLETQCPWCLHTRGVHECSLTEILPLIDSQPKWEADHAD